MKRIAAIGLALAALLGACSGDEAPAPDRVVVVASVFPLAELAARIGGERVEVSEIVPAGAEPHDVELTAADLALLEDADLVLYVGSAFQPAVADAVPADRSLDLLEATRAGDDPHLWLDPVLMRHAADLIARRLGEIDPPNAQVYLTNLEGVTTDLDELTTEYADALTSCEHRAFVTAHDAFGHLASRFGLTQHAIAGISPENEPTAERLEELRELVQREGITTVFAEALVPRRVAETLAREAGVEVEVLDPIENATAEQRAAGGYLPMMRENLRKLADALGCSS